MTNVPHSRPVRPWRRGLRRALGAERNELARPEDRARSRAGLLATIGTGLALVLGVTVAWSHFDSAEHRAAAASSRLHRLDALLLTATSTTADRTTAVAARYQAAATWTYPAGQQRTGTVNLSHRARAGSTVDVWADDTGRLTAAPPSTADLFSRAVIVGLLAIGLLFVLIASGLVLRLRSLDHRADTAWQRAWAELEPVWTGRAARQPGTDGPRSS
ncbi:Rv1733c family protein [Kitasatospora terrestris]|uniref:Transmembrane protein n=1 Tax=Kitasatospora terrestris TaxID=258051 RepID=A0ABP9EQT1_9ACTN